MRLSPVAVKSARSRADAVDVSFVLDPTVCTALIALIVVWAIFGCLKTIGNQYDQAVRWHNLKVETHRLRLHQQRRLDALLRKKEELMNRPRRRRRRGSTPPASEPVPPEEAGASPAAEEAAEAKPAKGSKKSKKSKGAGQTEVREAAKADEPMATPLEVEVQPAAAAP
jgi:hypothetical protein